MSTVGSEDTIDGQDLIGGFGDQISKEEQHSRSFNMEGWTQR